LKFKSSDSSIIYKWLNYFLNELKNKSLYVVATKDISKTLTEDGDDYLEVKKGDLITLDHPAEVVFSSNSTWVIGTLNIERGYFPINDVVILPCILPPRKEIIDLYARDGVKLIPAKRGLFDTAQRQKMHTLKKYAEDHFRPNIE
jgi:hypothetical protein